MIDIGWLAQNGPCKKFSQGQTLPCPGSSSENEKAMYILLAGRVDVTESGKNASAGISMFPGDVFGGAEYFKGNSGRVYKAAVDSVAYLITESSFSDLTWSQPDTVLEILKAAYIPHGRPTPSSSSAPGNPKASISGKSKSTADAKTAAGSGNAQKQNEAAKGNQNADNTLLVAAMQDAIESGDTIFPQGHKQYPSITKPEYAKLVYKKDYTCPFCKKKFDDFKIFTSKLYESAPMRFDLRRFYTDFQSEWFDIITCKHCYFSSVHSYITEPKPILKQKIENELNAARSHVFLDFDGERDINYVFTSHYLGLLCADSYLSQANPLRAKIWGNLSWLYEDVGDEEMERFAALNAANAYEDVFSGTRLTPVQEQTTCLSIAGMQRRAGIDKDLKKFLFHVKTNKLGEKAYIKLAEDIMDELRGV